MHNLAKRSRHPQTKVPEITIYFWIIKVLTTAMGESASDYSIHVINPVIAVALGGIVFLAAMALQFKTKRYTTWIYWLAVSMVAVFGTMAADVVHVALGVPYFISTIFFGISLMIIFALWYRVERSLSIHSIYTPRRELFYWATILATFALGTAAGDMTAVTFGWGYLFSGIVFTVLIAAIALAHYVFKEILTLEHRCLTRNAVLAFWSAYIVTRPLGASFADWMGKPVSFGGIGLGDGTVTLTLTILIIIFIAYMAATKKDIE
jgi:uncharacterized membrane-anchored protein